MASVVIQSKVIVIPVEAVEKPLPKPKKIRVQSVTVKLDKDKYFVGESPDIEITVRLSERVPVGCTAYVTLGVKFRNEKGEGYVCSYVIYIRGGEIEKRDVICKAIKLTVPGTWSFWAEASDYANVVCSGSLTAVKW